MPRARPRACEKWSFGANKHKNETTPVCVLGEFLLVDGAVAVEVHSLEDGVDPRVDAVARRLDVALLLDLAHHLAAEVLHGLERGFAPPQMMGGEACRGREGGGRRLRPRDGRAIRVSRF